MSVGTPTVSSMEECLDKCSGVGNCMRFVCSRYSGLVYSIYLTFYSVTFDPTTLYCNLLDWGTFSSNPHGSQLYAFSAPPPATTKPSLTTRRCSTACPAANGQIYVSQYGEVRFLEQNIFSKGGSLTTQSDLLHELWNASRYSNPQCGEGLHP